jgi:PAS domain S-box-containing protein
MAESIVESSTEAVLNVAKTERIRVLHVDDDPAFLKVAKQCLDAQGEFEVDTASSVNEALEKLEKTDYDAVVSDYQMPDEDGLEFLKELREKGNTVPFIVLTGKGREEVAIKALNLGANLYVDKHGDPETVYYELAHAIRQAVERKTADMKMWEREERLRAVFGSSPDAITVSDLHGSILDCNEAAWKVLGFSSKEEVIGKSSLDFIAKKDRQKALENMKKTLEQGAVRNLEYTLLNKDGEEFWGELSASILKDSLGNPLGFVDIMRDITARKKTEKTLSKAMRESNAFRKSGIEVVGSFPWGTHLCQFYKTKDDLLATLVPYFSEGLRNNEYCMWVTSEPLGTEEAKEAMRKAVPDFDRCLERGQIEILPHTEWYLKGGAFNSKRVLDGWINRLNEALAKGYDGLRLTGNTFWLEKENWNDFVNYEKAVNSVIEQYKMIAICTYYLDKCQASEVIDVVSNHQFALIRRSGEWKIIESSNLKHAREEVRASNEILRDVFACSPEAIAVIDLNGNIVECNQETLDMLGYSSRDELIGRNGFALVSEKDRERAKGNLTKVLDHGSLKNIEYVALTKDGTEFSAELSASVVKDSSGNPMGFVSMIKDISERKKAEEALRGSEEKWRSLAENAPNIIVVVDRVGTIQFINRTVVNARPEEIVGRSVYDFIDPEHHNVVKKIIEQVFQTGEGGRYEISGVGPKGSVAWYATHVGPIKRNGQVASVTLITTDFTERKKAEEALKDAKQKWASLTENTDDIVMIVDSEGIIQYINRTIPPYTPEETIGKTVYEYVPREQHDIMRSSLEKTFETGVPLSYVVSSNIPKIGTIWFKTKVVPAKDDEKTVSAILISTDITELKNTEEHLKETNMKLVVTNEKLHVVGGLTRHDVRNKLSAVTGNAYLLRQKLVGDAKALEQLKDMEAAVRLVEKIFEFARIYEKLGTEQLVNIDVGKAVDGAVSLFSGLKGVKIVNECHGLTVLADSLLSQLFYNLIDNSLKYGEKTRQIKIYYGMPSADQVELVYEDDGVGIPDNMRSNLFKEGFTSGKGTGYGLFMAKRISEVYGWTILETGKQGKGAQFTMSIPRTGSTEKPNCQIQKP